MALYHGYGTVLKEYKTIRPNKSMCSGCYCDFYNHGGIAGQTKECWSFAESKVVDKIAYHNINCNDSQRKKYIKTKTLSCYHGVNK